MRTLKALSVLSILIFSGCSSLFLSPEVKSVDYYHFKARISDDCKELGKVEAEGRTMMDESTALSIAIDNARQKAYDLGANTLWVSKSGNYFVSLKHSAYAEGIAYSCPK